MNSGLFYSVKPNLVVTVERSVVVLLLNILEKFKLQIGFKRFGDRLGVN